MVTNEVPIFTPNSSVNPVAFAVPGAVFQPPGFSALELRDSSSSLLLEQVGIWGRAGCAVGTGACQGSSWAGELCAPRTTAA